MVAAIVCREMGWTYLEYLDQPAPFVDNVLAMLSAEAEDRERRNKRAAG